MSHKIVIIDNDVDLVETIVQRLEIENIEVVGVGNTGKQAVELCLKLRPDIILLDLEMPKCAGVYTIENIQKIDPCAKFIVMSSHSEEIIIRQLQGWVVHSIIQKSKDMGKIVKTIKEISSEQMVHPYCVQ